MKRQKSPARVVSSGSCAGKRRFRSQGDALDAVAVLGLERRRSAYICPLCGFWHLTSK